MANNSGAPTAATPPPAKRTTTRNVSKETIAKRTAKKAAPTTRNVSKATIAKRAAAKGAMDYGYVKSFLDAHPDVAAKVALAVKQGWTASRLQAEIKTTDWWKTRTDAQRSADLLKTENPQEWQRQIDQKTADIHSQIANMGITLSDADITKMATDFVTNGSSQGEMQSALAMKFSLPSASGTAVTGSAGAAYDAITKLSSDYGVTLDQATAQKMVQDTLANGTNPQDYVDHFREQAKTLYPGISDWLDKNPNMTARDYASPYLQIASSMLGVPTDQMAVSDPKWSRIFSGNQGAPLTADQWNSTIKTDGQYGWDKTFSAQQDAYRMVDNLRTMFQGA